MSENVFGVMVFSFECKKIFIALKNETAVLVTKKNFLTQLAEAKFRCRTPLYHRRNG